MKSGLPPLTSLQFLVLVIIGQNDISGFEVREQMAKSGVKLVGPAFYQAMSRLETSGWLKTRRDDRVENGQRICECRYRITRNGFIALGRTRDFYRSNFREARGV